MFDEVTYGNPWYYWFRQGNSMTVNRVVRDHSGGLWVSQSGYSTKMSTWLLGHSCLGAVAPPVAQARTTIELNIEFSEEKT